MTKQGMMFNLPAIEAAAPATVADGWRAGDRMEIVGGPWAYESGTLTQRFQTADGVWRWGVRLDGLELSFAEGLLKRI